MGRVEVANILNSNWTRLWGDKNWWDGLSAKQKSETRETLTSAINTFENTTFPKTQDLLGRVYDRKNKIDILFTPMKIDVYSYTRKETDIQTKNYEPTSNEKNLIYFNSSYIGSDLTDSFIAVSFADLIIYERRNILARQEEWWISPLISLQVPNYLGLENNYLRVKANNFVSSPFKGEDRHSWIAPFSQFIYERVGSSFLYNLAFSPYKGAWAVDDALKKSGSKETFETIFHKWNVAAIAQGAVANDNNKEYEYAKESLKNTRFVPTSEKSIGNASYPEKINLTIRPKTAQWIKYIPENLISSGERSLVIDIETNAIDAARVSYITFSIDGKRRTYNALSSDKIVIDRFGNYILSIALIFTNSRDKDAVISVKTFAQNTFPSGSLIREKGKGKVYTILENRKRWIRAADIFENYGHLRWENIHDVEPNIIASYKESFLIKTENDPRVWEVNGKNEKRWLNITPDEFIKSGRSWQDVFVVNEYEALWYKEIK